MAEGKRVRLDARKGDWSWQVYDAERCEVMRGVVWVDDVTNEYGTYGPVLGGTLPTVTHKVRKIDILPSQKLVIINPVEDRESDRVEAIATIHMTWPKETA